MIDSRRFRTVREIMEYYFPARPVTGAEAGKELAEELLAEFRQKLRRMYTTNDLML